jgi:hypothetical protein
MRAVLLLVAVVALACHKIPSRPPIGGQPGEGGRELPPSIRTGESELSSRIVKGKEEPNILLADDRSRCRVSEKKYRETAIGEAVLCAWRKET